MKLRDVVSSVKRWDVGWKEWLDDRESNFEVEDNELNLVEGDGRKVLVPLV